MDRARVAAVVVSIVLIGATLSPLSRRPFDDGFPLSTYPMFASKRPTTQTFHYALGVTAKGERRTLAPWVVGTGEILQALRVLERATTRGNPMLGELCNQIAARVRGDDDFADIVAIRMVTGTHDAVQYLAHGVVGLEIERARCEVVR